MNVKNAAADQAPLSRPGASYLTEQLRFQGVGVPIPEECLREILMNALAAAQLARRKGEAYEACLHRQLDARARFIALWLSSDERFEGAAWKELVTIALKHALPRSASSWQRQPRLRNEPPKSDVRLASTRRPQKR